MRQCFWCHKENNSRNPNNPFCTNRCWAADNVYNRHINKLRTNLINKIFRSEVMVRQKARETDMDRLWSVIIS